MRFRGSPGTVLAGALFFVLIAAAPAFAAAPPGVVHDARRTWQGDGVAYKFVSPGRWVEINRTGRIVYRENNRKSDYVELYDPLRKRHLRLYSFGTYVYVAEREHFKRILHGGWDDPNRKPLDLTRNSSDRHHLKSADQRKSFPRLGDNFEVMAPATVTYNCICWSLGLNSSWVWPRGPGQPVTLADFDGLYSIYGYKRVAGLDFTRQEGVEKVVVFAVSREGRVEVTHACRQLPDGTWSSKLGSLPLIRHLRPDDVAGPTYGSPYVLYVRSKPK
jgi:hypothetical protein